MNSKVKIGIAAVVLCALIGLILLDQKTAPKDSQAPAETIAVTDPDAEAFNLYGKAQEQYVPPVGPGEVIAPPPIKADPQDTGKRIAIADPAPSQDYVIQPGDTYASLAEKFYGDRNLWSTISQANPAVKPTAMRPGKTISIPSRPERNEGVVAQTGAASRTYVVQSGDTLEGISKKIYNSAKYTKKIFEANRDILKDAGSLNVGMTLTLPEPPAQPAAADPASLGSVTTVGMVPPIDIVAPAPIAADPIVAAPAAPAAPADVKRVHKVQSGESLWKIAEKYCGTRGILPMIDAIVKANPDKLKDDTTMLKLGWELTIPE